MFVGVFRAIRAHLAPEIHLLLAGGRARRAQVYGPIVLWIRVYPGPESSCDPGPGLRRGEALFPEQPSPYPHTHTNIHGATPVLHLFLD